jgi:hypothetical protein
MIQGYKNTFFDMATAAEKIHFKGCVLCYNITVFELKAPEPDFFQSLSLE